MADEPQIDWSKYQQPAAAPSIDFSKYSSGGTSSGAGTGETPAPGPLTRFIQSFGAATGAPPKLSDYLEGPAFAAMHPIESAKLLASAQSDAVQHEIDEAYRLYHTPGAGNKIAGLARGLNSVIPILGPLMGHATEQLQSGDVAGGLGTIAAVPAAAVIEKGAGAVPAAAEAVPGAIRSGWRTIGNPFGLASTGEELLTQGISPRTSLLNFKPSLERAAGDLKAYNEQSPINSVQDLHDAIPEIKQKIWSEEVEPALQRQAAKPVNMKPVADAVRAQISDEMRTFDEGNAEKLDKLADKLDTTKDVASANSLLKYINGQLESYFQKFPAARRANLMNNPETAGWEAARAELRNQFLGTLEDAGENGVRDARLRYGAFDTLQDAVERRVNVADRQKPMSLSRIIGMLGAVPTAGTSLVLGELSNYLNKPDVLIRRGIRNLPEPETIRATPWAPPSAVSPLTGSAVAKPEDLFRTGTNQ